MGHHGHSHAPSHGRAFAISIILNIGFVVVEVVYGFLADSTALVADAAHNLGDVLGLALAWGATRLARIGPSDLRTFGWRKSTVIAALLNAIIILAATGGVVWEALDRLGQPISIDSEMVIIVATVGVVINGFSAALFFTIRRHDANIRGAFIHLAADAAISIGVVIAGFVVLTTGWDWVDPVISLVIAVVIVVGTWGLLRDSVNMIMDAVPPHINLAEIRTCMASLPGIREVHHLHVWAMSTNETSLTAHITISDHSESASLLRRIEHELSTRFDLHHTTIQIEAPTRPSPSQPGASRMP